LNLIKIDHLNLSKYARMIENSELRDDLDKAYSVYTPKLNNLNINMDSIPIQSLYNANKTYDEAIQLWYQIFKKKEKLLNK